MNRVEFTTEQRQAIETIDRSVLVTAAAGSGKTAVLTARCAYLVAGLPPGRRCGVDELLVVTFTEAAAAEMRRRICGALRERLAERPSDGWLREQLGLIETARISTIHAFCLWVIRRWYNLIDVDPAAVVFGDHEARLAKTEVITALFDELYEDPSSLGEGFRRLVTDYGLGRDEQIASIVRSLAEFAESLPDPDAWLDECAQRADGGADGVLAERVNRMADELSDQVAECRELSEQIGWLGGPAVFYADAIEQYADQAEAWRRRLTMGDVDGVCAEISRYKLSAQGAPQKGRDFAPEQEPSRDEARAALDDVKKRLFEKRLKNRFARFTKDELLNGLQAVAPAIDTLVALVREFTQRYGTAKRAVGALDYADLERFAYRLLTRPEGEVASVLRSRFAHVLVDEFQDINPLQEAILREVSREPDPDRPDNLFAVGDVKQSIYGFRLAEPRVLLDRERQFTRDGRIGACIRLQQNYRSRKAVVNGVNLVFGAVMRERLGGVDYDENAELRFGKVTFDPEEDSPVELHLLDKEVGKNDSRESDEPRVVDPDDPTHWSHAEREAAFIGQRLKEMIADGVTVEDGRPLQWSDVVVLRRSTRYAAPAMADMLTRMGIPAFADAQGALFETVEARDVLSALEVLDNASQDIPLAAVLRSGIYGDRFSEDDLLTIRLLDWDAPFYETVRRYGEEGADSALRTRVRSVLGVIERFRSSARQRPLADMLWELYEQTGYLAYVGGLPGGAQRRANLIKLHERARQFGTFQRQGVHRFLRFIDALKEEREDFGTAPSVGESGNVVRIMSIHRSKGLQFPIVFVAGLGQQFNLADARGKMIYDRRAGIGLKIVDRDRMIEYPSALHQLVVENAEHASRAEELRVLYVAMTRAEERLILVGSTSLESAEKTRQRTGDTGPITPLRVVSASHYLDWIVPALATDAGSVAWPGNSTAGRPVCRVCFHAEAGILYLHTENRRQPRDASLRRAAADLAPLPQDEPLGQFAEQADEVVNRLDFAYPHLAESSVRAVVAASELKRPFDAITDPDEQPRERVATPMTFDVPGLAEGVHGLSPTDIGTATHTLLEHLPFDAVDGAADVSVQARRLVEQGVLTEVQVAAVDLDAVVWFVDTPLARRIRQAGSAFRREQMFVSAEPPTTFDRTVLDGDVPVVVRGIVDGVLVEAAGLELLDYKTDRIGLDEVPARADHYRMQMRLYARAMAKCWKRPVRRAWLVFLHPRKVIEIEPD